MDEMEKYQQRLQAIAEKRRLQEEQDRAKREMEDERLKLQQLKRKSLRDQWLMDGPPLSPTSQDRHAPRSPLWGAQAREIEEHIDSLQAESKRLVDADEKLKQQMEDGQLEAGATLAEAPIEELKLSVVQNGQVESNGAGEDLGEDEPPATLTNGGADGQPESLHDDDDSASTHDDRAPPGNGAADPSYGATATVPPPEEGGEVVTDEGEELLHPHQGHPGEEGEWGRSPGETEGGSVGMTQSPADPAGGDMPASCEARTTEQVGGAKEEESVEGVAKEGVAKEEQSVEGVSKGGVATEEGPVEGVAKEGVAKEEGPVEGMAKEGVATEEGPVEGVAKEEGPVEGVAKEGVAKEEGPVEGVAKEAVATEEGPVEGVAKEGVATEEGPVEGAAKGVAKEGVAKIGVSLEEPEAPAVFHDVSLAEPTVARETRGTRGQSEQQPLLCATAAPLLTQQAVATETRGVQNPPAPKHKACQCCSVM